MGRAKRQQMRDRAVPGSIKLKSIFKGTRGEREKPSRQRDILENMQAMKQRVDNWREVSAAWCPHLQLLVLSQNGRPLITLHLGP